jgi:hypothetical protein
MTFNYGSIKGTDCILNCRLLKYDSRVLFRSSLDMWCRYSNYATGWKAGIRFPEGTINLSVHHSVQTGSGAHPALYPMGTGGCFSEVKAAEA